MSGDQMALPLDGFDEPEPEPTPPADETGHDQLVRVIEEINARRDLWLAEQERDAP